MDLEMLAIAGVLLLGGGITILVFNLRKAPGSGTLDQIGTYGYVAEAAGGSEVDAPGRRPLDSLAGRLGDVAARRLERFSESEVRQKLVSAGMYGTSPRKILGYQVLLAVVLPLFALWMAPAHGSLGGPDRPRGDRRRRLRLVRARWPTSTGRCASGSTRSTSRCRT